MISKHSSLSAIPLAMLADARGVVIMPVAGTPLANLVTLTNNAKSSIATVDDLTVQQEVMSEDSAETLQNATSGTNGFLSNHDSAVDSYVSELARAVTSHISFAKNVVAPVVLQMSDDVKKAMDTTLPACAEFCINVVDLPLPMQSSTFEESVSKYTSKSVIKPERDLKLQAQTVEGILELIRTGSKVTDTDIELWYAGLPAEQISCVWDNVFRCFKESLPACVKSIDELCTDPTSGTNLALLIFLIARKLYDDIPDNTAMTLPVFKDVVSQIRDYSGTMLSNEYIRYNASIRNKTLLIGTASNKRHISVNGAVYREWLKTGGSNEIILGMVVSNATLYSVNLIDKDSEKFLAAWNTYEQYSNTAQRNKDFNKFKQILKLCFARDIANLTQVETELKQEKPDMYAKVPEYFSQELDKLRTNDMQDIHGECLKLVCRARFYYTDAEKILQGINDAVKANPNISVRDAAAVSTCEYVFDYISDQMRLVG